MSGLSRPICLVYWLSWSLEVRDSSTKRLQNWLLNNTKNNSTYIQSHCSPCLCSSRLHFTEYKTYSRKDCDIIMAQALIAEWMNRFGVITCMVMSEKFLVGYITNYYYNDGRYNNFIT